MLKLIKQKTLAFRKRPDQLSDLGPQPHAAQFSSTLSAIEGSCDRPILEQIRAEHLARPDQQVPDVPDIPDFPPLVRSPSLSRPLLRQAQPTSTETQTISIAEASSSKGKAKAQSDADYDLALALLLQAEEDGGLWLEPDANINELDDDECQPHLRSRPTNLQPISRASLQPSHTGVSASGRPTAVASADGWEAYDARKWATASGILQPQLQYAIPEKECIVCANEKSINRFPQDAITGDCTHDSNTCLDCVETHIKTELESKLFHDKVVACPECSAALVHDDIRRFADPTTFESYASRATEKTIDQIADLFRCPDAKCNSAQMHIDGEESPIVICIGCQKKYCFKHKIAWHESLGCDEYDQFLANPRGFKSRLDLDNERAERERLEEQERLKHEEEASSAYIQKLLEGEELEEARRQAEAERVARTERERLERAIQEEKARRAEEARHKLEEEALQKQRNEQANLRTIQRTTKNCPSCNWAIEKNEGCAHMTCIKCRYEFHWCCLASYHNSHRLFCLRI